MILFPSHKSLVFFRFLTQFYVGYFFLANAIISSLLAPVKTLRHACTRTVSFGHNQLPDSTSVQDDVIKPNENGKLISESLNNFCIVLFGFCCYILRTDLLGF